MKLRAIIVDDEDYAREIVKSLLADDSDIAVVAECTNGAEAIVQIKAFKPDLVFLDIQMPEINGFEVIEATRAFHLPHYIFATAYDSFALKAFEVNAIDYLLKPFDDQRFFEALGRAKERIMTPSDHRLTEQLAALLQAKQEHQSTSLKRIPVKTGSKIQFVDTGDIEWIEADNQYVKIHSENRHYLHRQSLTELESLLDPTVFIRIHRSAIVNMRCIESIEPYFRGDYMVNLKSGTRVKLAKSRKEDLRKLMGW